MFTEIGIENFKAFGKIQRIPLKPITLLYGPNSSGKSSFIQALQLFKQTLEEAPNNEAALISRGTQVDLGGYSEFIHKHDEKRELKILFSFNFLWDPDVCEACSNSQPPPQEDLMTMEFTFMKDKAGDVIVKTLRLFYRLNPEPLLVYRSVLLDSKLRRKVLKSLGKNNQPDLIDKSMLFLESINFNSEFIKANWDHYAQYYGDNNPDRGENRYSWDFSEDLHALETMPALIKDNEKELKILKYLKKIDKSFRKNSFMYFSDIGTPPTDRIIRLSKCFPSKLAGWRYTKAMGLDDYGISFNRQFQYTDIVPIDLILLVTNLLSQYLNKVVHIGPLREFPQRSYSFSGYVGKDVGKSGEFMSDILLKNPEIVDKVNKWLEKFDIDYEIRVDGFKRDVFILTLIDKKTGTEVSPTDVGFGISQLLPIIVQGVSPDFIYPGYKIICIEQPEIHLHPRLQGELGSFFAECIDKSYVSENVRSDDADIKGNQFIIETHSENLVLRLQKLIRKGELKKEHVGVLYFDNTSDGSTVKELRLNDQGEFIDPWPNGFFEESFKEMFGE
jgi:predicted ATPase